MPPPQYNVPPDLLQKMILRQYDKGTSIKTLSLMVNSFAIPQPNEKPAAMLKRSKALAEATIHNYSTKSNNLPK
jgi:hypothetical protein